MLEENGNKENGPNLGRRMEFENESKKLEEIIKKNEKSAYLLSFPTTLQK